MGFSNYLVTKTGFLVRKFIRSFNYVAGVSGFSVNADGSAEFNSVTVRGAVEAVALYGGTWARVVLQNGEVDFYTGPGATGPWTQVGQLDYHNLIIPGTSTHVMDVRGGLTAAGWLGVIAPAVITGEAWYAPSGDTTGATDGAVIAAMLSYPFAVHLLPGDYYISAPITVSSGGILAGAGSGLYELTGTVIHATAGFSGAAMITMPAASSSQEIRDLCLDGSAMPAGTADGIAPPSSPSHTVLSVKLENLEISGAGISHGIGNINAGTTWRGKRVFVHGVSATAFNIQNAPDSCWIDCASLGAGGHGWQPFGASNATFIGCRAEFSAGNGFNLSGAWGTGTGSGGLQFTDCSTDRNTGNGVDITATGTAPVTFSGLMTRRDGNGTGTAAVHVAAGASVVPVSISGWQCFPGVDDNGGGTLTPANGLLVSGAVQYLAIVNAYVHAATTGVSGMTALNNVNWRAVATRTGSTSAPGAITLVADSA